MSVKTKLIKALAQIAAAEILAKAQRDWQRGDGPRKEFLEEYVYNVGHLMNDVAVNELLDETEIAYEQLAEKAK